MIMREEHDDLSFTPNQQVVNDQKMHVMHKNLPSVLPASFHSHTQQPTGGFKPTLASGSSGFPKNIERMFETFHQSPHGDFRPTFYNPFEVKHRRRTTKGQFKMLEKVFHENNKPPASLRRQIASKLGMTPRAVQVWFQNRRAKLKTQQQQQHNVGGDEYGNQRVPELLLSRSASASDLSLKTTSISSPSLIAHSDGDLSDDFQDDPEVNGRNDHDVDTEYAAGKHMPPGIGIRPRSNSCPSITSNCIELPFKPLQDALFAGFYGTQPGCHAAVSLQCSPCYPPNSTANSYHSQQHQLTRTDHFQKGQQRPARSKSTPHVRVAFPFGPLPGGGSLHHPTLEPIAEEPFQVPFSAQYPSQHQSHQASFMYPPNMPHPPNLVTASDIQPHHLLNHVMYTLQHQQQAHGHSSQPDPADFDYLLQTAFGDQWLYYPSSNNSSANSISCVGASSSALAADTNNSSDNRIPDSINSQQLFTRDPPTRHQLALGEYMSPPPPPPDAFLMSFVEDASFEGE